MHMVIRVALVLLACASTAQAALITLANGDELRGEILRQTNTVVYFSHPQLGELQLSKELLLAFDPEAQARRPTGQGLQTPPARLADAEAGEPEPPPGSEAGAGDPEQQGGKRRRGLFGTRLLRGWDNRFGMGLSGSEGGFEDTKLNILFSSRRQDDHHRWLIDSNYFLNLTPEPSIEDTTATKNQGMVLVRRDWLRTKSERWQRLFSFAQSRYRFDQFQGWKHRLAAHVGPGYKLLRDQKIWVFGVFGLDVRAGLGGSYAFGDVGAFAGEALFGFSLGWGLTSWSSLDTSHEWILNLTDASTFRTNQQIDWNIDVGSAGGLGVQLGARFQHDTQSTGRENDFTYLTSLTYDF